MDLSNYSFDYGQTGFPLAEAHEELFAPEYFALFRKQGKNLTDHFYLRPPYDYNLFLKLPRSMRDRKIISSARISLGWTASIRDEAPSVSL